jgi:hypothetical protein
LIFRSARIVRDDRPSLKKFGIAPNLMEQDREKKTFFSGGDTGDDRASVRSNHNAAQYRLQLRELVGLSKSAAGIDRDGQLLDQNRVLRTRFAVSNAASACLGPKQVYVLGSSVPAFTVDRSTLDDGEFAKYGRLQSSLHDLQKVFLLDART